MNKYIAKAADRLAPRTMENIKTLNTLDKEYEEGPARFVSYERELRTLRREIDELRRDNRRVAELYDIVFEWAKTHAAEGDDVFDGAVPTVSTGPSASTAPTVARHGRPVDFAATPLTASTAVARDGSGEGDSDDDADEPEFDDEDDA